MLEDLSFSSLKLAHTMSSRLSLWSYVSRHHIVKRDNFLLLFENLHMLNAYIVQFSVTTASFPFIPDSILFKLDCDQHNKEQKKALRERESEKKNF